jgi:hypothetical protein
MALSPPPKLAYEDPFCMVATRGSFIVHVMGRQELPVPSAREMARVLIAYGKVMGHGKLAEITLIAHDAPLPGAGVRAAFDAAAPIVAPYYCGVAAVFEGTGFRAAMVRGIVTSFQLLSPTKYPQSVFSNVDDTAKWLLPHVKKAGVDVASTEEIAELLHTVRNIAVARKIFPADGPAGEVARS